MSERDSSPKEGANRGNAGKGRPKGSLNKTTASIKAALLEAFEKRGGVDALVSWGDDNPTEFYKLIGRLVPHEVSGPDGAPLDAGEKYYVILGGQKVPF
jgi:hypothetical protein